MSDLKRDIKEMEIKELSRMYLRAIDNAEAKKEGILAEWVRSTTGLVT